MDDYTAIIQELQKMVRRLHSFPTSRSKSIALTNLETAILWLAQAAAE